MINKLVGLSLILFCAVALAQPPLVSQAPHACQPDNIPSATPTARFVDNGDGTVTDSKTDLVWKKCVEGLSGEACAEGEATVLNWGEALLYMSEHNKQGDLGYTDWRLPNIRELSTLVETRCMNPAINEEVFPGTPAGHVWTSSPYHFYTHYSWYVDFGHGSANYDERIRDKGLRLVRNGQ